MWKKCMNAAASALPPLFAQENSGPDGGVTEDSSSAPIMYRTLLCPVAALTPRSVALAVVRKRPITAQTTRQGQRTKQNKTIIAPAG